MHFQFDETGMPLDPKSLRVVVPKGMKNPSLITSGNKAQITVVGCICAAGFAIPPMIVWDRKTLHPDMTLEEVPGTFYGLTSNGWMDMDLFEHWLTLHFLRYAPPVRPLLLLMDGHSSHYSPAAIRLAAEQEVILLTLPPNTTHVTQPLDKRCFGPLKVAWRDVCQEYVVYNPGKVVTRMSFSPLFSAAWRRSMTMQNVISSFKVTGIYPVDRTKVLSNVATDPEPPKLSYIPLLTPTPCRIQGHTASPKFSDDEVESFLNKSDSDEEERYQLWKKMYEPDYLVSERRSLSDSFLLTPTKTGASKCRIAVLPKTHSSLLAPTETGTSKSSVAILPKPHSSLFHMFKLPSPVHLKPVPQKNPQKPYRVLTSAENLKYIEEKERKKQEDRERKEKRKKEREMKKQARELKKQLKKQAKQSKTILKKG